MAEMHKAQEMTEAASKLREELERIAVWDELRPEIEAARLKIRAELDAYRSRKPNCTKGAVFPRRVIVAEAPAISTLDPEPNPDRRTPPT